MSETMDYVVCALLIGADLSIASVSGGGTEVWLSLPMERV